jgi:hypothetical protein
LRRRRGMRDEEGRNRRGKIDLMRREEYSI